MRPATPVGAWRDRTARRIASENGSWSAFGKRKAPGKGKKTGAPTHDDLVQRVFIADALNRVRLVDITEQPTAEGKLYLCPVMDVFSSKMQIANYLSAHSAGLLGIIVCRTAADRSAEITRREQWVIHRKLILVLNGDYLRTMLALAATGQDSSTVICLKFEDFRLGF